MKDIIRKLLNYYLGIVHLFYVYSIIIILLFLGYRIEVYGLIKSIYKDLNSLSFPDYFALYIHFDAITIFYSLIILMAILLISKAGIARFILASMYIILKLMVLLLSINFFRVYETTFQSSYWGKELSSGFMKVLRSGIAELPAPIYIKLFITSAFIITISIVLYQLNKKYSFADLIPGNKPYLTRVFMFSPLIILLIIIAISFLSKSESRYIKLASKFPSIPEKKIIMTLYELSMNPVYNIFSEESLSRDFVKCMPDNASGMQPFSFQLDTASLESAKRYPKLKIIPRGKRYNIIFYFFESVTYKYLDIKINEKYVMQTWHRMKKNSLAAENHYANYPLSANAMLTVFTSAYDLHTRDFVIQKYPDIKLKTISEILKANGYRTCLIHTGGLGYAGQRRFLKNRKFDRIIEYNDLKKTPPYNYNVGWGLDERSVIKPAVRYMKEDLSRPYFISFFPVNPHHPYAIPDKSFRLTGKIPPGLDYKKRNWLNYLNSLHYADAALGALVDKLEKEGLLGNTLFFLFADHGEAFYQHRKNYNHPFFLYEENVHVPFLIYNKKLFKKSHYFEGITRHTDILPTVLDILGLDSRPEQEGISILSAHREQLALLHTYWKDDFMGVRDGKWKYICRMKDNFEELYDLSNDPDEKINLSSKKKNIVDRYRKYIFRARKYKIEYYKRLL